ncbi:MAG: transcriptional regulator [Deltaproteobacteria bacterium]|nr:transcriptional regulator [Deltaproteobacteria bacterium]
MGQAAQLVKEARDAIRAVEERLERHPYLEALEGRRVPKERLALFAGQQTHIIESDLRSVALAVTRAETPTARGFFMGALQGEQAAWEALKVFARAVGLSEERAAAVEPLPGAFAYSAYVAWLALYGSSAEFAGAFLINLPAWGANCGRMSRVLKASYGLVGEDVAFFDLFATGSPEFERAAVAVIDEGLAQGVRPERIRRAARLLQGYELLYWDTLHEASHPS